MPGAGVYKNGGPTNVDHPKDLSGICDRTAADVRGVKKTISASRSDSIRRNSSMMRGASSMNQ